MRVQSGHLGIGVTGTMTGRGRIAALLDRGHEVLVHPGHLLPHRGSGHQTAPDVIPHGTSPTARVVDVSDMTEWAPQELAVRVLQVMENSKSDFRTPDSLARELAVSEADVRSALVILGDKVRRPLGGEDLYPDWFRPTSRRATPREKWWRFRTLAGYPTPGV